MRESDINNESNSERKTDRQRQWDIKKKEIYWERIRQTDRQRKRMRKRSRESERDTDRQTER